MAISTRQKILLSVGAVVLIAVGQIFIIKSCSFQAKAIILRAEFVLIIESVMFFFSRKIWKTITPILINAMSHSPYVSQETESNGIVLSRPSLRKNKNSDADLFSNHIAENHQNHTQKYALLLMKSLLLIYLGICHVSYLTNIFIISTDTHWFGMLAYTCLGSFVQLVTGLYMFKLLSFIIRQTKKAVTSSSQPKGLSQKSIAALSVTYMICASTLGLYTTSRLPTIRQVDIPVKDLSSNLEGLHIIQLSDIHLGPTVGLSRLIKIVEMVNKENPDVVVITGDLVDGSVEKLKGAAQPLSTIQSKYGKFFVSGNHEYYTGDVDNWFAFLKSLGFTVLHNSNLMIPDKVSKGQGQLCMAGTDDVQADKIGYSDHKFDLSSAVGSCPSNSPVILLAHQPVAAKIALDSKYRVDLVLSGHTHGGQMFPMIIGAYLLNPFYSGLYKYGSEGSHVYVSQGTQYWGIPMRIGTTMEITRITLRRAS